MAATPSKSTYVVLRPVLHGKKHYKRGEGISLTDNEAGHLVRTLAIAVPTEAAEALLIAALPTDAEVREEDGEGTADKDNE